MASAPAMVAQRPSRLLVWLSAIRPATLSAGFAPVLAGTALAASHDLLQPLAAAAALVGAICIQIGTNLFNDQADFARGADQADRLGPPRACERGWLSARQLLVGTAVSFAAATLAGVYLVAIAGWPLVWIGLASLASGLAYTGGPFPLGYKGLGDLFVFLFFGLIAVCGTYYVQAGSVAPEVVYAGVTVGLLATAVLVVNNLRDREGDARAGKRTLAVRFGAGPARAQYAILVGGAFLIPLVLWLAGQISGGWLLVWLCAPLAVRQVWRVAHDDGAALNASLGATARIELLYTLLLGVGVLL